MAANTDPRLYARKCTDEQAVAIRKAYAYGWASAGMLGRKHGVTPATIFNIVQGCAYKSAGGPITWPGERLPPQGEVRGHCREEGCNKEIADSGWAQRMRFCPRCFVLNGGKKCGRPQTGKHMRLTCRVCRKKFEYYVRPNYRPKCCSLKCGHVYMGRSKSARPKWLTKDRLYEMYWGQNKTAPEIVKSLGLRLHSTSVIFWLKKDGTPRRVSNWRTYTHCIVDGCGRPRFELRQHVTGRPYGRLCKEHYNEREARNARIWKHQQHEQRGKELTTMIRRLLTGLPDSVRADAESEIVLAVLSGELVLPLTGESVKPFITKAFHDCADQFGTVYLDTPAPGSDGEDWYTWGHKLGLA